MSDELDASGAAAVAELEPQSPGFPALLRTIPSPPLKIYLRGRIPPPPRVAVIGARRCDAYGMEMAERVGAGLARAGVCVVSGGAAGVDTAALQACLDAGGQAVAVLGTGVDVAYPAGNRALFERVAARGALLSEYPPGTPGRPAHFPRRNRLISGLAEGVVVVRASSDSGSLITARAAVRQGRRVMAIPGPAGQDLSAGPHQLLRQGATLIESPEELLSVLALRADQRGLDLAPPERASVLEPQDLEPDERRLYELLGEGASPIDVLVERSGLSSGRVAALLLKMEFEGLVQHRPGMVYALSKGR
ncbi:MAG: DNA-processing protein DprA [Deltaproteobacteria bacterium]|nr:DNA-processing protein DprA [Deltaproteobacteria bacterium]